MKSLLVILVGFVPVVNSPAAIRCVDVNNANPTRPHTNWVTATNVIQDAVDLADVADEVVVTKGVYATGGRAIHGTMTNRVAVDKALVVRSVNGPALTVIRGYQVPGSVLGTNAIRCVYLTNGASISGFTIDQWGYKDRANPTLTQRSWATESGARRAR